MRIRHKVPSVFNLSMVDVLCCALGCVIVLWLYNAKEYDGARTENDNARRRALQMEQEAKDEKGKFTRKLATMDAETDRLTRLLNEMSDKKAAKDKEVEVLSKSSKQLKEEWDKALETARKLEAVLAKVKVDHKKAVSDAGGLSDSLAKKAAELSKQEQAVAKLLKQVQDLEEALKKRDAELARLDRTRKTLEARVNELKDYISKEETRFAGIDLKGTRVIFLVDASGSMILRNRKRDPKKWQEVCDTIAQVTGSIRGVKQYQLITFSATTRFPLGDKGKWLDFDNKAPERIREALRRSAPHEEDPTNMYAGLEAAFKYHGSQRLDTIYLFSDGLPNRGPFPPGWNSEGETTAANEQKLGEHVRNTLEKTWNKGRPIRIHAVGFYYESPTLGQFLWSLARENRGGFVGLSRP